jgi:hypothetical protein
MQHLERQSNSGERIPVAILKDQDNGFKGNVAEVRVQM